MKWNSPREALAHYYAARRGPNASALKWDTQPTASYRHDEAWMIPARLLHGNLGVPVGSELDEALEAWATDKDPDHYTPDVRRIERQLLTLMREHEIKIERLPRGVDANRLSEYVTRWTDENGRVWIGLKGWE
jgi:hypothetical protein